MKNARNLFADGKLDLSDYRELKDEFQPKLNVLKANYQRRRTGRVNEAVRLIYSLDKGFSEIKKPDSSKKMPEPGEVTLLGLISNHFLTDLKLLASISA